MNISQTFVFIGRSGCGKGTQLDLLKGYLSNKFSDMPIKSIIMGEIFREFFKESGYVQDIARDVSMKQGKFQPDFLTNALFVRKAIDIIDSKSFLFLDGYPRRIEQLEVLEALFSYSKRENIKVINLEVSRDMSKQRMLLRGRADDSDLVIESRLNEYDENVVPMIEKIKSNPLFQYIEIDGEPTIEEIHKDIISKLEL